MRFHPADPRAVECMSAFGASPRTGIEVAIAAVAALAAVAGAGASYVSSQQQASAQRQNASNQRMSATLANENAEFNALQSEKKAIEAREGAQYEEDRLRERNRFLIAEQRAKFGASGVLFEGSPLEVLGFQAGQNELDALAVRRTGQNAAADALSEAASSRYRGRAGLITGNAGAALESSKAANTQQAGYGSAATSLLSGASSWYNNYGAALFKPTPQPA